MADTKIPTETLLARGNAIAAARPSHLTRMRQARERAGLPPVPLAPPIVERESLLADNRTRRESRRADMMARMVERILVHYAGPTPPDEVLADPRVLRRWLQGQR